MMQVTCPDGFRSHLTSRRALTPRVFVLAVKFDVGETPEILCRGDNGNGYKISDVAECPLVRVVRSAVIMNGNVSGCR